MDATEGLALIYRTCAAYERRTPVSTAATRCLIDVAMARIADLEAKLLAERAARDQAERELDIYAPPPQDERERRESREDV